MLVTSGCEPVHNTGRRMASGWELLDRLVGRVIVGGVSAPLLVFIRESLSSGAGNRVLGVIDVAREIPRPGGQVKHTLAIRTGNRKVIMERLVRVRAATSCATRGVRSVPRRIN